ncbi:choice-of-anchor I family protein [Paenibacillus sp. J5C_2022]|uniref:choice-of-anchor I family protein n=1 Tax=Paenibacillus sp. J5C2022 TaxID=2977129 RepID=UPI0021D328AA|nr:choice-of-anchor I family protein [Paenibacillus sp. J5C2022]MCU6713066.1 choice-of-anchor I family protein [Paenibacillus sp. J5C2022]
MNRYRKWTGLMASSLVFGAIWGGTAAFGQGDDGKGVFRDSYRLNKIAHYSTGMHSEDGGIAEIVKYNKENGRIYLVNGSGNPPSLDIIALGEADGELKKLSTVLVQELAETDGFRFGDLTSVAVNTESDMVYIAVQEADPIKQGKVLALDYDGKLVKVYEAGVQPDMVTTTADGKYVLTANEAEPRSGKEGEDPRGSVTVIDTEEDTVTHVYFDDSSVIADDVHIRGGSNANGVMTEPGSKDLAEFDLEPEYITIDEGRLTAYVTLQENNAVAIVDIQDKKVTAVKSLGLKDYSKPDNVLDIRKNDEIAFQNVPFHGMYMPDGIASYTAGGHTYLLTANEGDATGWPDRTNESSVEDMKGKLDPESALYKQLQATTDFDGVEVASDMGNDGIYMYGGRSFSIWDADTMEQVYDSGSQFERITAERIPDFFNTSNSKASLDNRSEKKGPEPEDIVTGEIDGRTFAFIGLERIGGVMMYDVTNPVEPRFASYANSREFADEAGEVILDTDTGPEGLSFITAEDSPTGHPLLLVAYEVGGKIGVYEVRESGATAVSEFTDIADSDAKEAIMMLAKKGIVNGAEDGRFEPQGHVTRAEFVAILSRAASADLTRYTTFRFADVDAYSYYGSAAEWGAETGIVKGVGGDRFNPDASITREDMAVMLKRFADVLQVELPKLEEAVGYGDEAAISEYAKQSVSVLQLAGIVGGIMEEDGEALLFAPDKAATRELAAQAIAALMEHME